LGCICHSKQKILNNDTHFESSDFYNNYKTDIALIKQMGIPNYRFSLSWSRILPNGVGVVNQTGLDFYHNVLDCCIENGITPFVTLYHWDLPQELEEKGGWTNREILGWFEEYVSVCVKAFKDKVTYWMVLNEPMVLQVVVIFLVFMLQERKDLIILFQLCIMRYCANR